MNRLPISVCMISGAEAHRIGRSLASVGGSTSEIIVVLNDQVADGTEQVAERFGAKVFREPWKGHVAQKNSAAERATQPWVYSMESVDHQIWKTIRYADDFAQGCRARERRVGLLDLLLRPPWRFFRGLVIKLGFLDGWQGFAIAWMSALYTFLRYFKALEVQRGDLR